MKEELPDFLQKVVKHYPQVWDNYQSLGRTIAELPGLDKKTQRLMKLAIAIGAGREGAVHSHTRRCKKAGLDSKELHHAALLAITTIGWSGAIAALSWIEDELQELR